MLMKGTARKDAKLARVWQEKNGRSRLSEQPALLRQLTRPNVGRETPHSTSSPIATCSGFRNVLISAPYPQTVTWPKRLNQSPSGTIGFPSIQWRTCIRSSFVMFRSATRSRRWASSAGGRSARWISGIELTHRSSVISLQKLLLQFSRLLGVVDGGESPGDSPQLTERQLLDGEGQL